MPPGTNCPGGYTLDEADPTDWWVTRQKIKVDSAFPARIHHLDPTPSCHSYTSISTFAGIDTCYCDEADESLTIRGQACFVIWSIPEDRSAPILSLRT